MLNRRKFLHMLGIGAAAVPAAVVGAKEPDKLLPLIGSERYCEVEVDWNDFDDEIITFVNPKDYPAPRLELVSISPREDGWLFDGGGPYLMSAAATIPDEHQSDIWSDTIVTLSRPADFTAQFMYHDMVYETVMLPAAHLTWTSLEAMQDGLLAMFKEQILYNSLA